jgi:hypothetical protein
MEILIGADPEVFMKKDGRFICAHNAVPGDKSNPHKVDKGAVQVDGFALEFNIDPASNAKEFVLNLTTVMDTLAKMVPDMQIMAVPVAEFGKEYIKAMPAEAQVLGCDPDFNAWEDGAINPKPNGDRSFRTGAGHVHIGFTKDMDINDPSHIEACIMLTKQLDYYLGLGSLLFDKSNKRRKMYGAAGAYRVKPYGVEYRVLSNAWLKSEELMTWVFNNTKLAVERLVTGVSAEARFGDSAQHIINRGSTVANIKSRLLILNIPLPPKVTL